MKGQIFSLDLFVSLIVVVLVISLATVLISRSTTQAYDSAVYAKLQSLAMDYAALEYYKGVTQPLNLDHHVYVGQTLPSTGTYSVCVSTHRGTGANEVVAYACQ